MAAPKLGEDGVVSEAQPLPEGLLPSDVGLRKQSVVYSCLDASQHYLVVGSLQGYVWVVDLKSMSLLREFNEFKGSCITVVKLNPSKDCVAYATDTGFVRVERVTRSVSTKWKAQEKSSTPICCLEWSPAGDNLYIGFPTGRVIQFHLQYPDGAFSPVQLPENYGSRIVQLSASNQVLLVSTEERALLLNVATHKLDQIGRKDRKAGPYGGFFVQDGSRAYVARPGLRLWVADNLGKVSHTVAFKEALSTRHLPAVNVKSLTSLQTHFSKSWQFTSLHPWIMDRFVLSFHNNTLFILDPEEGRIIGVLSLQYSIAGLATSGGHIFLMVHATNSKKIIKLSIHSSLVKLKSSPFLSAGQFAGNLSAASSRANSREGLDQIHIDKDSKSDGTVSPKLSRSGEKDVRITVDEEREKGSHVARVEEKSLSATSSKESVRESGGDKDKRTVELLEIGSPLVEGSRGDVEKDGVTGKEMTESLGLTVEETAAVVQRQQKEAEEEREIKSEEECIVEKDSLEAKWLTGVDISQSESEQAAAKTTENKEIIQQSEKPSVTDTTTAEPSTSSVTPLQSDIEISTDNSGKVADAENQNSPTKKESESEKESSSIPEHSRGKSIIPTLALAHGISHVKADLKEIKGALKLGKLTEFISQATHHSPTLQRKSDHHSTYSVSNDVVRLSTDPPPPSADREIQATPTTIATPIVDPEEQQRRLRMAEMVEHDDEDVVVATKSQTKTRKTRKRRTKRSSKHSSATSSKSVSMEQLYELDYEDEEGQKENQDTISPLNNKTTANTTTAAVAALPSLTAAAAIVALPSLTLSEQQEAELNALELAQQNEQNEQGTPPPSERKLKETTFKENNLSSMSHTGGGDLGEPVDIKDHSRSKEDEIEVMEGTAPSAVEDIDLSTKMVKFKEEIAVSAVIQDVRIEQESGQEMIEEEMGGANDKVDGLAKEEEEPNEAKLEQRSPELATKQEVGGVCDNSIKATKRKEQTTVYKPLFDEVSDSDDPLFGSSETSAAAPSHNISSIALAHSPDDREPKVTPDLSDNPLYHDSEEDEELSSAGTGREWFERAGEFGHMAESCPKGGFLSLQPAAFDPLQSDEFESSNSGAPYNATPSLEYTLAHARYSSSPEQLPHTQQPQSLPTSSDMRIMGSPPPKFSKTEATCPVLSPFSAKQHHMDEGDKSEGSDSSHESDNEVNMDDSQVVADWYKLCGGLVQDSRKTLEQQPQLKPLPPSPRENKASFEPVRRRRVERVEKSLDEEEDSSPTADIWVPIPHPSRHNLQSMSLSEKLLWVVDTRWNVYCTTMESRGRDWQNIKRNMNQVSSSPSGNNVWGIYKGNAYVRLGIGMNPEGSQWRNITKNTHLAHRIKQIAVDETAVWVISTDGKVLFRKDVGEATPEGKVWQEVTHGSSGFSFITSCHSIVWAITASGKVFCRMGISPRLPSGKRWADVKAPKFVSISITSGGVVWGVSQDNSIGFRCGVSASKPAGKGSWWEVCINALNTPSSSVNPLWHVMSPDGNSILTSVSSFVTTNLPTLPSLPGLGNKVLSISASSKSGVVVLETGSRLRACWRSTTGFHYTPACKGELFQFMSWSKLAAGGSALWLVRADDGDLYSLAFGEHLTRIECPAKVDLLAASPSCMWIVSKDSIWSRQALTAEVPEGISFDYIELSTQLNNTKLRHVSCGKRSVWAVDTRGVPHFRFGVHAREPGTGMSPAWVPVEDNQHPLLKIAVSPDDWLVWACDENYNVYVRTGVTTDFPVGRKWELIPGEHVKELCASNEKVYALSQSGELLCRYGISESNVQGNYWRKMPGKYVHITVGEFGELFTMDTKGQVWKQERKLMTVASQLAQGKEELEKSMMIDQSEWEML